MTSWLRLNFAVIIATSFLTTTALAHSLFGSGMYGGLQSCPFPYGVPAGAVSYLDDIAETRKKLAELEDERKQANEDLRTAKRQMESAQKTIGQAFQPPYGDAILEHLKSQTSCRNYDWTARGHGRITESICQTYRGTQGPVGGSSGGSLPQIPAPPPKYLDPATEKQLLPSSGSDSKPQSTSFFKTILNFFKNEKENEKAQRLPASDAELDYIQYAEYICNSPPIPNGLSPVAWFKVCEPSIVDAGKLSSNVCNDKSIRLKMDEIDVSDCNKALEEFRENYLEYQRAERASKALDVAIKELKKDLRKLNKDVRKVFDEAVTEAQHCPWCQYYESQKVYDNMSTSEKVGSWIRNLMPLLILGGGAYLNYRFGTEYMENAAKLGYLTGPTPSFLSYGWPFILAGVYGSIASAVNGGFGCAGGPWGAAGIFGPYAMGGLYGGLGGAFGLPAWMMGIPMGGGIFMPGMGPWGMATPFGMINPFMGMGGGLGLVGMMGLAGGGVFPGFPMGGFAMGGMGGLAIGGMGGFALGGFPMIGGVFPGFPMGGFAMGGMGGLAIGGMGGLAITGMAGLAFPGMGLAIGGFPMAGGFAMGGLVLTGMAGMAGLAGIDMGIAMQFAMMQQQMVMQQYQMYMQVLQYQQHRQMARMQVLSALSQELMALQLRIQQVSMGLDIGLSAGAGVGVGPSYPGPYGPYTPPYVPPYLRPGVSFPGYYNWGAFQFGTGR